MLISWDIKTAIKTSVELAYVLGGVLVKTLTVMGAMKHVEGGFLRIWGKQSLSSLTVEAMCWAVGSQYFSLWPRMMAREAHSAVGRVGYLLVSWGLLVKTSCKLLVEASHQCSLPKNDKPKSDTCVSLIEFQTTLSICQSIPRFFVFQMDLQRCC